MSRQIVVDIVGDASKFNKATQEATQSGQRLSGLGNMLPVVGFAAATVAVIGVGKEVLSLGSKYEAMDAKAKTVFGDSLSAVDTWADKNAAAMGLTSREATGLAASMGDLLVPMGFTRDQAVGMSTDIVGLSGALSEWSGGTRSAAEVSAVLQKALLGERDGLKELGISISEADVSARLLKDGTDKLTGSALAQAKAQATQALIFEKSTDAQNAFTAGTAKGIRAQHEIEAAFGEIKETLVEDLYPVLAEGVKWFAESLPKAIETARGAVIGLDETFKDLGIDVGADTASLIANTGKEMDTLGQFIGELSLWAEYGADFMTPWDGSLQFSEIQTKRETEAVIDYFKTLSFSVKDDVHKTSRSIEGVGTSADTAAVHVKTSTADIVKSARDMTLDLVGEVKTLTDEYYGPLETRNDIAANKREQSEQRQIIASKDSTKAQVADAKTRVTELQHSQLDLIADLAGFSDLTSGEITSAINKLKKDWHNASDDTKEDIASLILKLRELGRETGALPVWSPNVQRIAVGRGPLLHAGGIVPGRPGSDVPAILQAGERVLPAGTTDASFTTDNSFTMNGGITINAPNFMGSESDKRTLVRSIFDLLKDEERRRGLAGAR